VVSSGILTGKGSWAHAVPGLPLPTIGGNFQDAVRSSGIVSIAGKSLDLATFGA